MSKDEREADRRWKTGLIIMQDDEGHVVVDNSMRHFKDQVARECTIDDAIYMLQTALTEFHDDKIVGRLRDLIKGALTDGV